MSSSRNVFTKNWVTLRDLNDIIRFGQRRKKAIMILGGAGLGKSAVVKQITDAIFGKRDDNMVDIRLSDKEPTDVVGLQIPYTDDKGVTRTVYATPSFWPTDPKWCGTIFLDELLHAEPYMQKVAFQIVLDRRIGEYVFPEGAVMVAAGNRSGDGTAVSMLEAPLANRMIICELAYSTEVFLEDYAYQYGVHSSVVGVLKATPSAIENYEAMEEMGCPSFATPRSWVTASDILYDYDQKLFSDRIAKTMLQGAIGETMADTLWIYHTKKRNIPSILDIVNGVVTEHSGPRSSDILWVIGAEGVHLLREAVHGSRHTDDQVVEMAANFLKYMYENFNGEDADFVMSVFMSFIQKNAYGNAILVSGPRDKLVAKLLGKYPVVVKIVREFGERFAEALKELNK